MTGELSSNSWRSRLSLLREGSVCGVHCEYVWNRELRRLRWSGGWDHGLVCLVSCKFTHYVLNDFGRGVGLSEAAGRQRLFNYKGRN